MRDLASLTDAELEAENNRLGAQLHDIRQRRAAADAAFATEREAVRAARAAITAERQRRADAPAEETPADV